MTDSDRTALLEALAVCFDTAARCQALLEQAGIPSSRLRAPGQLAPLDFWRHVLREIDKGLVTGGRAERYPALARAALADYPNNQVFQKMAESPSAAGPTESVESSPAAERTHETSRPKDPSPMNDEEPPLAASGAASSEEIPQELVERARAGRLVLFVGAGCCRSAGLPGWEDLLRRIEQRAEGEHLLSQDDRGRLKAWFRKVDDYPRIAKLFKDRFPARYRDWMQDIFDPSSPAAPPLLSPAYFRLLRQLPLTRVLTTNFDQLLEDALQPGWTSLTWQDVDELPRFLRSERRLIFHVHGRADRFGTLVHTFDEYRALAGPEGREARGFLQRIFESSSVLVAGYRLGDPVIRWLQDQLLSDWNLDPDWYALAPDPGEEERHREREERELNVIAYRPEPGGAPDSAHDKGLMRWFTALLERIGVTPELPEDNAAVQTAPPVVEIDDVYLRAQPPSTPELAQRYYRGEPARWSLVNEGHTASRRAAQDTLELLKGDGLRAVLLLGAGGEGKSTILMQVGLTLKEQGFRVFWSPEGEGDLFAPLKDRRREPVALLVD